MRSSNARCRHRSVWLAIGVGLLLTYVVPLFVPPPAQPVLPPTAASGPMERLFPGVPGWWVLARLGALAAGAMILGWLAPRAVMRTAGLVRSPARIVWQRRVRWLPGLACVVATAQLALLHRLADLTYLEQAAFILAPLLPALLLWIAFAVPAAVGPQRWRRWDAFTLLIAAVVVLWSATRLYVSWHAPRAADIVDMWRTFAGLVRLAATKANFLMESMGAAGGATADKELQGVNAIQLFFQGLPILQWSGRVPDLLWMQAWNTLWLAATAVLVGGLARDLFGRPAMPVAAAGLLFSPFLLLYQMSPLPMVAVFLSAALLVLLLRVWRSDSPAALALFGCVAGMTATMPTLVPMTGLALLVIGWHLFTASQIPRVVCLTALLSFLAVLGTGIPDPMTLRSMVDTYALKHWPWSVGERALQGQLSPTIADWTTGDPPPWYLIPLGTLLSPFVLARNSHRLWGDTLYEPVSVALLSLGLVWCVRRARHHPAVPLLVAFLVASLLPGFLSSYDRPAPNRVHGALIPLALLSAAGFRALAGSWRGRRALWASLVATLAIGLSGTVLFDVINPRLLSASALGLVIRAVAPAQLPRVALLTAAGMPSDPPDVAPRERHYSADWLRKYHPYADEIARCVPRQPLTIASLAEPATLDVYELLFWSPAVERTARVTAQICARWPGAALYTLSDPAHLSQALAARPQGPGWKPELPKRQWTVRLCERRRGAN